MADIMANIEDDDDSRTAVPRRKKRPIVESDPEDMADVPEEVVRNPMAPVKKKRRPRNDEEPQCSVPTPIPLQPTSPAQVPPIIVFRHQKTKPHHTSRSQFRPQLQSTLEPQSWPQKSPNQAHPTNNQFGTAVEDDPMQDENYHDRITQG